MTMRTGLALAGLAAGVAAAAPEAGDWKVPAAPVRFAVRLAGGPTHPSAGYFVTLPDGGILPRPQPQPQAVAADGTELKTAVLWQNPETGVGVVFAAPPQGGEVKLYVSPARRLATWTPESGLTPSAMLCTHSGTGDKAAAYALAKLGGVPATVHYQNRPGGGRAPVSLPGDLSGRGGPCALYMLAHVATTDPGKTWIAPITFHGGAEVRIDGTALSLSSRSNKPGGTGQELDLSAGLHRLEIFGWSDSGTLGAGIMTLTWRTPRTTPGQMGGIRPSDLPHAGTPMWESRPFAAGEIVRSGEAVVTAAESRDRAPVARFQAAVVENFWFDGEKPLLVCKLSAQTGGNPADTRYAWSFGDEGRVTRPEALWLFPGEQDHRVTLTASAGDKSSSCTVPFYPYTTGQTDLNNPNCRENFRLAALEVFEAYPAGKDPTAAWTPAHWNNFFRCLELDKGRELLTHIFQVRWDAIEKKITPAQRAQLVDFFLDFLPRQDPALALKWSETLEDRLRDKTEAGMMRVYRAEVLLYYRHDPEAARKILDSIVRMGGSDEVAEWARIRSGDLEFLAGNLDAATRLYGEVQTRAKNRDLHRQAAEDAKPKPASGLARSKADLEARRAAREKAEADAAPAARNSAVAEWKVNALLDVSASENVKSLIEQGFLLEARRELRQWERKFPLSKLSSDYILNEGKLFMALGDWGRANATLSAYCDNVDASSFVAEAAKAALACKQALNVPNAELLPFCEKMEKKLKYHPVADEFRTMIRALK